MSAKTKQVKTRAHSHARKGRKGTVKSKAQPQKETPLAQVKRLHSSKEGLIEALAGDLARETGDSKDSVKERLAGAPNTKLLRLHQALTSLRDKYGSKDKLIQALSQARGHGKDRDYAAKLQTYSIPRLLDMMRAAS
jgi:hypothetical protein